MNIWQDFKNNNQKEIDKWLHYFPVYERHFSDWRNKTLVFWEIGVQSGGSLQMWQRFFGPSAIIIGIDIDPECAKHSEDNIVVRIGNQTDKAFLQSIVDDFGPPDIILDDGSHVMSDILETFMYMYPLLSKNGVYMVEDLHTAYDERFGGNMNDPNTFINVSKSIIDDLNAEHTYGKIEPNFMTRFTLGIHFYDSVVVYQRGIIPIRKALRTGNADM